MSNFQIILLSIFGFFIVVGLALFAIFGGKGRQPAVEVTLWGTFPERSMRGFVEEFNTLQERTVKLRYVEKKPEVFDQAVVEAVASGKGPDLLLFPSDSTITYADKVVAIPYSSFSLRDFKNTFAEIGELFLEPQGILAIPLIIDPLISYWNRDIFSSVAISRPPERWAELLKVAPTLTIRDRTFTVSRSAVSLGEFRNVSHAKEILSALILQGGNPIVTRDEEGLLVTLHRKRGSDGRPNAVSAIEFFTSFADPVKVHYSWNRSLEASRNFFTAGDLAFYLGLASDIPLIRGANPNLNFDVSALPQVSVGSKVTFGRVYGVALMRHSPNRPVAGAVMRSIMERGVLRGLSEALNLAPARRDLLAEKPASGEGPVVYAGAIQARGWLDPKPAETLRIFGSMIESVTSGRSDASEAVAEGGSEIEALISSH